MARHPWVLGSAFFFFEGIEKMTEASPEPLTINYYTDILCVWAWIAKRRIDELEAEWGAQIRLTHHCVNVFGDTEEKMTRQWAARGGFDGFADHVQASASSYETAPVHPDLWRKVRPSTSATAHLVLKAAEITRSDTAAINLATAIRQAFFIDARDISQLPILMEIAAGEDLDPAELNEALVSGRAMAALLSDYSASDAQGIKGSPSWVMNQGRQILYGNLGYRILHANVEELLRHPEQEASWC
jgi:predicted DsbA family dithiol-disulfide isomerase